VKTVNTTIREEYDDNGTLTSKRTEIDTHEVTNSTAAETNSGAAPAAEIKADSAESTDSSATDAASSDTTVSTDAASGTASTDTTANA
jgi:hypothetical protein